MATKGTIDSECPFISSVDTSKLTLYCEGGKLKFHSKRSMNDYKHTYCDTLAGCKKCSIYKNLQEFYERNG